MIGRIVERMDLGYNIIGSFDNSVEALEFIKTHNVQVVLSDVKMPNVSGLDIATYCSTSEKDIKVILISAHTDFEYIKEALRHSVTDYITKPIDYDEFRDTLAGVAQSLDKRRVSSSFPTHDEYQNIQNVFSRLSVGDFDSESEILESIYGLGYNGICDASPCATLVFGLHNMSNYFLYKWKYDKLRFYNALLYLIPLYSDGIYCFLVKCTDNALEYFVIGSGNTPLTEETLQKKIGIITDNAHNLLNLDIETESVRLFSALTELIRESKTEHTESGDKTPPAIIMATEYIASHLSEGLTSDSVAAHVSLHPVYFRSLFKHCTGVNFITYLTMRRLETAKELLQNTDYKISAICEMIGYKNHSHFYKLFKEYYGCTPAQFRENGADNGGQNR